MKFCSHCGNNVSLKIPEGDNLQRFVCDSCSMIHYQNPKIVTGTIPEWGDQILLCRRAIEPRQGYWTLPAGFMENHESAETGARRETLEETGLAVAIEELYALFNIPYISQVYLMFRATMPTTDFGPTSESLEVKLFDEADIPWDELAFAVVKETLQRYFADRKKGRYVLQVGDIARPTPRT